MYVQHAAHRLYPERVKELIRRSHEMLVPTFIVISDKWSVGKQELATKESEVAELVDQACPPPECTRTAGGARPPPAPARPATRRWAPTSAASWWCSSR